MFPRLLPAATTPTALPASKPAPTTISPSLSILANWSPVFAPSLADAQLIRPWKFSPRARSGALSARSTVASTQRRGEEERRGRNDCGSRNVGYRCEWGNCCARRWCRKQRSGRRSGGSRYGRERPKRGAAARGSYVAKDGGSAAAFKGPNGTQGARKSITQKNADGSISHQGALAASGKNGLSAK
jgi:hypothetical protein